MKPEHRKLCFQAAQAVAIASAVFMLLAGGVLIANQFAGKVGGMMKSQEISHLQAELKKQPKNEQLKDHIRLVDLHLRRNTFYQLELSFNTTRALVWSLVILLASVHLVRTFRATPPNPLEWGPRDTGEERQSNRIGRYAVAAVFGFAIAAGVMVSIHPVQLPGKQATVEVVETPATAAELAANWISFRGPNGRGQFPAATIPVGWDGATGKGVLWKTEVPLPGLSSPVRWDNALFLTGSSKDENRLFRFDVESGALVWSSAVKVLNGPKPGDAKVNDGTGLAAPTPVIDGRRVYVMFANGDVAAFTLAGKQVWAKSVGLPENSYGYSASLLLHEDKIFIQYDVGSEEDGKSKMIALDSRTGQEAWSVKREVGGGWTSPALIDNQVVAAGNPWVVSYDPATGKELWKANLLHGDVAPSPIQAGGFVVVTAPGAEMFGLKDGKTVWTLKDGVPETSSPGSDGQRIYVISSGGALTCIDAATGKVKWTEELGEEGYASPVVASNGVLIVQRNGTMIVVENADAFKQLHKAELGEACDATPLLHNGRIYIRGQKHLYCLGEPNMATQ